MSKEQRDTLRRALAQARIPAEYQEEQLSLEPYEKQPGVKDLRVMFHVNPPRRFAGETVLVHDTSKRLGTRVSYLIARALVLSGTSAQCFAFPNFADRVHLTESQFADHLADEVNVIVILGFNGDGENPLDLRLRNRVEWFIDGQLSRGRGLVLHTESRNLDWWSRRLVNRIREKLAVEVSV